MGEKVYYPESIPESAKSSYGFKTCFWKPKNKKKKDLLDFL